MMQNNNWLPHLTNEMMIGARNNNLCSYVIALEGWRRGLTLKFYSRKVKKETLHVPGCLFSLSDGNVTHTFYKSRGMRVKGEAFTVGGNKILTKNVLNKNGIPVPTGDVFPETVSDDVIIEYANKIGFPVVLKPADAAQGKGVIANIGNEEYLRTSLKYVRDDLNYKSVILEEHITGDEFRVYVMEDDVIAVLNRVPANVVGDGIHNIEELIRLKNKKRKQNPRLFSCLIKIDYEIKNILNDKGYTLETIPKKGQKVFLREKSNISSGGDSIDVTDEFPEEIKKMAIDALKQIPNFPNGGVDIMVDFSKPIENSAKIIELTPVPQIGSLVFPMEGKGRDVPSAIIDYYFPKTKDKKNNNPNIYFDLKHILAPLMSKSASEVTVIPCPTTINCQRKYIIKGEVQGVGFRRWIRKKALEADLYGYAQNLNNGDLVVAVAGDEDAVKKFREICAIGPKRSEVKNVLEEIWQDPIKVGFEIKRNPRMKNNPIKGEINDNTSLVGKIKKKLKKVTISK